MCDSLSSYSCFPGIGHGESTRKKAYVFHPFIVYLHSGRISYLAYTSFQLDSLQEVDKNDSLVGQTGHQKHAVDSLANQTFNYTDPNSQTSYQGISASNINMTTDLTGVQARLDISVYVFKDNGSIEFGNETFEVRYWTFKFNIKVSVYCRKLTCFSSGD